MLPPKSHVCVVGAGISGLRCAEVLLENGFEVTILEARDRIGGRICQSDKLGYKVDLGPNWIHTSGQGRNPILDLANKTRTPLHHWNNKQNIFSPSGKLVPEEKADKLSSLLWEHIAEAFKHSAANGDSIHETESLYDYLKLKAIDSLAGEGHDGKEDVDLLLQMAEMWGAYIGDPVAKQSLKFAWMEECCGGDDEMFVETTWEAILAEIARIPLEKAEVRLGQKVIKVKTMSREFGSKVVLTTDQGESLEFDEVVMTTPLGWLKSHPDSFEPPLPDRINAGINGLSIGHLEKVYITFPSAFWLDPSSNDADTFPGYTNWLSPNYAPETNPSEWPVEMWNLASFTPSNRHPTLIFYLYGPCSVHLVSLVHSSTPPSQHSLLEAFFAPYLALLPNFSPTNPACIPTKIVNTAWQKDELSGYGSYVNVQVGAKDAKGDVEALRRGVEERRLWFAGEHTSPFEELGTVGGAWLSGERVGERIVECYKES